MEVILEVVYKISYLWRHEYYSSLFEAPAVKCRENEGIGESGRGLNESHFTKYEGRLC